MTIIDLELIKWATPRQAEFIEAINRLGSIHKAARELKTDRSSIQKALRSIKKRAAMSGWSPEHDMTRTVPEPFVVRGTSTLYDEDGKAKLQWVKTRLDDQKVEQAIRAAIEALSGDIVPVKPLKAPQQVAKELLTQYTFTDCHVGMKAWAEETGGDWDLKIAETSIVSAFTHLVEYAPPSEIGVVCQLGDFLHIDGLKSVTPEHGNLLDSDARFEMMVRVATRILRCIIDMALVKHKKVIVLMAEGNHDQASSIWLRHLFGLLYENEKRVEVIESPLPYYCYQHGSTMLAFHHGHLTKNDSLPMLFAAQFPKVWGDTKRRYCHTGHRHHVEEKEHAGMTVIQHPTLAARDAYAARGGWHAERSLSSITYHSKYGQVARNTVVPEMLK